MTAYEKPPSVAAEAAVTEGVAGGALRLSLLQAARRYRGNPRAAHFRSMRGVLRLEVWRPGGARPEASLRPPAETTASRRESLFCHRPRGWPTARPFRSHPRATDWSHPTTSARPDRRHRVTVQAHMPARAAFRSARWS